MQVNLCGQCYLQGYCRRLTSRVVSAAEITPAFIADVRALMRSLNLGRDRWASFLTEAYRDYPGRIVDSEGREIDLDTECFDEPNIRYWFRDQCQPVVEGAVPRLRCEAKTRFLVVATILRALYPVQASLWGKEIANDQEPAGRQMVPVIAAECPYLHFVLTEANEPEVVAAPFDATEISVTVSLPASVWDWLTEDNKGLDRDAWEDPDLPDLPLSERIDLFQQEQVVRWYGRIADRLDGLDPNDDVPF